MGRALKVVDKVCSVTFNSLRPDGLYPARLLCSWDSLGKNTGVGCHFFLQGIFPTQGSSLCLWFFQHWQTGSLPLSHLGSHDWQLNFIKILNISALWKTMLKEQDKPPGRKYFQKDISDKEVLSKIYREFYNLTITNHQTEKWAKDLNRHLTEEDVQMANKHTKRCFPSFIIRECKLKWHITAHLWEWQKPGTLTTPNADENVEQ